MSWFGPSFEKAKLKANLSMSNQRIRLVTAKGVNEAKIERREIAGLLRDRKFDKARIKVESLIRKEREREALEILDLMAELLVARVQLIASEKQCPGDLLECVHTIIWAAPRCQIDELKVAREQLGLKYGADFAAVAMKCTGEACKVNEKVVARLNMSVPVDDLKVQYLTDIAKEAGVPFDAAKDLEHSAVGLGPLQLTQKADAAAGGAGGKAEEEKPVGSDDSSGKGHGSGGNSGGSAEPTFAPAAGFSGLPSMPAVPGAAAAVAAGLPGVPVVPVNIIGPNGQPMVVMMPSAAMSAGGAGLLPAMGAAGAAPVLFFDPMSGRQMMLPGGQAGFPATLGGMMPDLPGLPAGLLFNSAGAGASPYAMAGRPALQPGAEKGYRSPSPASGGPGAGEGDLLAQEKRAGLDHFRQAQQQAQQQAMLQLQQQAAFADASGPAGALPTASSYSLPAVNPADISSILAAAGVSMAGSGGASSASSGSSGSNAGMSLNPEDSFQIPPPPPTTSLSGSGSGGSGGSGSGSAGGDVPVTLEELQARFARLKGAATGGT